MTSSVQLLTRVAHVVALLDALQRHFGADFLFKARRRYLRQAVDFSFRILDERTAICTDGQHRHQRVSAV